MSIIIKLDRPAVLGLIEDDPEFKFQLSAAVTSEVIRKIFEKDMARMLKEADPETYRLALAALQKDYVFTALNKFVTEKAQEKVDELLAERDIDTRIAKRIDRLVDEELERRVKAHNDALMAKLKGVLG